MKPSSTMEVKEERSNPPASFVHRILQSKVLRIAGTILCLWLITRTVDFSKIVNVVEHARLDLILAGWFVTCCVMVFALGEWGIVVRGIRKVAWGELCIVFLRMLAPSVVLPAGLGGEAVRIYQISRLIGPANATAAAAFARMSSALAMSILAFAGALLVHADWQPVALVCCGGYMLCTFAVWCIAFVPDSFVARIVDWLNGFQRKFISESVVPFIGAIHRIGKRRSSAVLSLVSSLLGWATNFAALQMFADAVGAPVPWYYFAVALPLSLVATFAPFVLGGIGVREGILMAILMQSGISSEQASVIALLVDIQMIPFMLASAAAWLVPQKYDKNVDLNAQ